MNELTIEMTHRLDQLAQSMQEYREAMTEALVGLCRIPSVKGQAAEGAPYGEQTARALDYFLELGQSLGFTAVNLDHRAGYIEWGEGDRLIAILCHLDVVPAGDDWKNDPWQPLVLEDRIIARGTSDDKGPAISSLFAIKALADSGYQPSARIRLILGLDEESGMTCMRHYTGVAQLPDAGFTADAGFPVIYAEKGVAWVKLGLSSSQPADAPLRLIAGQAGERPNMVPAFCSLTVQHAGSEDTEKLVFKGISAHAGSPADGKNALAAAMQTIGEQLKAASTHHPFVDFYRTLLADQTDGENLGIRCEDESGPLTVNAGILSLDQQRGEVTLDIRYPVTQDFNQILDKIKQAVEPLGGDVDVLENMKPLHAAKDSSLVQTLSDVYQDLTGSRQEPATMSGGSYARTMPNIVAFGPGLPGDHGSAHQVDETITYRTLLASAAIYKEALRRLSEN